MFEVIIVLFILSLPALLVFMCWAAKRDRVIDNMERMIKGWPCDSTLSYTDKVEAKRKFKSELINYSIEQG